MGPKLAGLRSLDVYHTIPSPAERARRPKSIGSSSSPRREKAGSSTECSRTKTAVDYVLAANKDTVSSQSVTMRLQSKWLGIAPWHEKKVYSYGIEKLDKATGAWETISSTSFVGFTFVIGAADGELFRITTTIDSGSAASR